MTQYNRSEKIGHLVAALAKARRAFKPIKKSAENPFYGTKYADLASLIDATKEALSAQELAILQPVRTVINGSCQVEVETLLVHSSDEWISSTLVVPCTKGDAQGIGSAITYGRRYSYGAILNLASEEDDDGNAAVGKHRDNGKATDTGEGTINPVQQRSFFAACKTGGRTEKQVAEFLQLIGLESIEQLSKPDLKQAIDWALGKFQKPLEEQVKDSVTVAQKNLEAKRKKAEEAPKAPPEPHYEPIEGVASGN
jgi:hypothetical protein